MATAAAAAAPARRKPPPAPPPPAPPPAAAAVDWRWRILGVVLALHVLLIPAYRSTDFEVHRNWLAITYSLPMSRWYLEATSQWTLDYPPFFAWFEWLLARPAAAVDPKMLAVSNLDHDSAATVAYQRLTVSATGLALAAAVLLGTRAHARAPRGAALTFLLLCNAGLVMVDNIHFQYNSFLMGVLMGSVVALEERRDLLAGALFTVLLHLKHLYAYLGPVYFVYLLRHHCMGLEAQQQQQQQVPFFARLAGLGALVLGISAVAWGPFVAMGQLPQVLARLFPFGRGLTHSYWAPNAWALYSAADKVLAAALSRLGRLPPPPVGHMAGGVVGVAQFLALPQVGPRATVLLVLLALLPCLAALWRRPCPAAFAKAVAYANLCGFVWGYHVHEKAVITATLPLAWALAAEPGLAEAFLVLSGAGHVGIFPLLHQAAEVPVRWCLALLYHAGSVWAVQALHPALLQREQQRERREAKGGRRAAGAWRWWLVAPSWCGRPAQLYLAGLVVLEAYCVLGHAAVFGARLPFVPLLLTSVYCAAGVCWVWGSMALAYARELQQ